MQEHTIAQLQARLESGELTARALTEFYLQRIADIDDSGPALNAVIEQNPDAIAIAERLDSERRQHGVHGPLHGSPFSSRTISTAPTASRPLPARWHYWELRPPATPSWSISCARQAQCYWARPT